MLTPGQNTGVIIKPPTPERIGAIVQLPAITNAAADWRAHESPGEWQKDMTIGFDTQACMSFAATDTIQTYLNWLIAEGKILPAQLAFLTDNGYLDSTGKVALSDRFTAYMSDTTVNGNDFENVWAWLEGGGVVPDSKWPMPVDAMNADPSNAWSIYYSPPTAELIALGKEFLTLFGISWRWLVSDGSGAPQETFAEWLQVAPVHVAIAVCGDWNNDNPIMGCGPGAQHGVQLSFVNVGADDSILDHYVQFDKNLAANYNLSYAVQGWLTQVPPAAATTEATPAEINEVAKLTQMVADLATEVKNWLSTHHGSSGSTPA